MSFHVHIVQVFKLQGMRHILVFVIDMIVIPMPSQSTEGVDDLLDASVEIELKLQFPGFNKVKYIQILHLLSRLD